MYRSYVDVYNYKRLQRALHPTAWRQQVPDSSLMPSNTPYPRHLTLGHVPQSRSLQRHPYWHRPFRHLFLRQQPFSSFFGPDPASHYRPNSEQVPDPAISMPSSTAASSASSSVPWPWPARLPFRPTTWRERQSSLCPPRPPRPHPPSRYN